MNLPLIAILLTAVCILCGIIMWGYTNEHKRWMEYKTAIERPQPSFEMWSQKTRGE